MRMRSRISRYSLACATALLAATGCVKNPVEPMGNKPPVFGATDSVFTDQQLRAAANSLYPGPVGFYAESRPANYTAPQYLTTVNVAACGTRPDQWIELSTDDTAEALAWVETSAVCDGSYPEVVSGSLAITQRYIEYLTFRSSEGARHPVRVHRASYIDRSGYDRFHPGASIGTLVVRPVDGAAARGVAEYLWYIDHPYAWPNRKVLTSFSHASGGSVLHTIYSVYSTTGMGLLGPYPVIELLRDDYRIDTSTGAITSGGGMVRAIDG